MNVCMCIYAKQPTARSDVTIWTAQSAHSAPLPSPSPSPRPRRFNAHNAVCRSGCCATLKRSPYENASFTLVRFITPHAIKRHIPGIFLCFVCVFFILISARASRSTRIYRHAECVRLTTLRVNVCILFFLNGKQHIRHSVMVYNVSWWRVDGHSLVFNQSMYVSNAMWIESSLIRSILVYQYSKFIMANWNYVVCLWSFCSRTGVLYYL